MSEPMAVIPDSFLGGPAPHPQHLRLNGISFPGLELPTLLLSASDLIYFEFQRIPHSWHIPPDVMVTHPP